ncbi:hypothetical protein [Streptomyces rugosispiralis]|uniref:Uncharacterized protein n=1 Tax=Streptomyces rugosispiralis TaxID=2967341 RepID=A0ABT1V2Q4_9ACTN|nr:hypothetical protein [Streptomyces rugosispiralis]MCQ8191293.1 hypothetical protein [Streptomyces rugosispiralis]
MLDDNPALWFLWDDSQAHRFCRPRWCETDAPQGDFACTLYLEHPGEHSWAFVDPVVEAFRNQIERALDTLTAAGAGGWGT